MDWLQIFVSDKEKRRARRKKKIKESKARKTENPTDKLIRKKKLGYKAVQTQKKKKKMLEDAGK